MLRVGSVKPVNTKIKNLAIAVPFALSVLTGCGKVESDRFESCSKNNVECCCSKCNEEKDSSVGLFRKVLAGAIAAVPVFFIFHALLCGDDNLYKNL